MPADVLVPEQHEDTQETAHPNWHNLQGLQANLSHLLELLEEEHHKGTKGTPKNLKTLSEAVKNLTNAIHTHTRILHNASVLKEELEKLHRESDRESDQRAICSKNIRAASKILGLALENSDESAEEPT